MFAHPGAFAFVGRATADTLRTGAGPVRPAAERDRTGRLPAAGAVYGQAITVDRLPPGASASHAAAVRRAGGRVVLVPWGLSSLCEPTLWNASARWVLDPGRQLYTGTLRAPRDWVEGVPTVDVFGLDPAPYRGGVVRRFDPPGPAPRDPALDTLLTPDELFGFQAVRPTWAAFQARADAAFGPLRAWARAHPTLAAREPARATLAAAERALADLHFARRPVPLGGTFRVVMHVAGAPAVGGAQGAGDGAGDGAGGRQPIADSTVFYVRTEAHPTSATQQPGVGAGVFVLACATATEAALPARRPYGGCRAPYAAGAVEGYVVVGDSAWTDAAGRRLRPAGFDVDPPDAVFGARVRALRPAFDRLRPSDERRYLPGLITDAPGAPVRLALALGPAAAPLLRVEAVRVSAVVLGPPADALPDRRGRPSRGRSQRAGAH